MAAFGFLSLTCRFPDDYHSTRILRFERLTWFANVARFHWSARASRAKLFEISNDPTAHRNRQMNLTNISVISSLRTMTTVSAMAIACGASAQDFMSQSFIKQGEETLTLNLGGILNQFGTSVKLNGPGLDGSNINLENSGLKKSLASFDAGGTWRFWSRNRIDVLYFSANRSGSKTIDRDLNIDGVDVPINSTLT